MKFTLLIFILILSGCTWKTMAPTLGGGVGAGIGSLGGPAGSVAGGFIGAGTGQIIKEVDENKEAQETLKLLSEGDVNALVKDQMENHSGFQEFKNTVKNILMVAGALLLCYLTIPLWLARKTATDCVRSEAEKLTRPPFPK